MTGPPILQLLAPAGATRPGAPPERAGAKLDRAWLASLERALEADRSLASAERKSKKVGLGVHLTSLHGVRAPSSSGPASSAAPAEVAAPDRGVSEAIASTNDAALREPLRWHIEWAEAEAGVRVWLGSDHRGDAALEAQVAAVVAELRRQLEERGVRLLTVTCNGREVWAAGKGNETNESRPAPTEGS
jgi:hypothetical protein